MSLLRPATPPAGDGSFWTKPWQVLTATGYIDRAIAQNEILLQAGGQPCYLFVRETRGETQDRTFDAGYTLVDGLWRLEIWNPVLGDDAFPDPRTIVVSVDGEVWTRLEEVEDFLPGMKDYVLDYRVRKVDADGNVLDDKVYIYFNTPPFDGNQNPTVKVQYESISPDVDLYSYQPVTTDGAASKSRWGFTQYLDPNRTYQGAPAPHTLAIAFPDLPVDNVLTNLGFEIRYRKTHWCSPPPYAPEISNHDIIVNANTRDTYTVTALVKWYIGTKLVSQHFNLNLVRKDSPYLNLDIVTT